MHFLKVKWQTVLKNTIQPRLCAQRFSQPSFWPRKHAQQKDTAKT